MNTQKSSSWLERIRPYLGDRSFYLSVAAIAIPIALQGMINIGVNMTDTVMLGLLGEIELSASSLANQFIALFSTCCMGIGMGASVLIARYWGMQDIVSLKKAVTIMYRLCFVFGLCFMVATLAAPEGIMRIYSPNNPEVIAAGSQYFFWASLCFWLSGFSVTTTIVLRSIGQVRLPLLSSILSFCSNIVLNWMFIFGNWGAPRMGIAGASFATFISRIIEFSIICGYFLLKEESIRYRIRDVMMKCGDLLGEYLKISIPVLVSDALLGLGNNMVAMVMGRIGPSFVSANAITAVTQQLSTVFVQGLSNAGSIMTGHTLGQGDVEKAQRQGVTFLGLGAVIGLVAAGIITLIKGPIIGFYNISAETRAIADELMLAIAFIVIFMAMNSILTKGVLRGGGDTKFLMVADVLFLWIASVPLGYLAGLVWHLPPFWIYTCLKIDQIFKAVWCVFRLKSRKWIKRIEPAKDSVAANN